MSTIKLNPRNAVIMIIIIAAALLRIMINANNDLSSVANFSSIGSMALFGGAYFKGNTKSFALPLLALFLSDLILSFTVYAQYRSGLLYDGWFWVYGAFALMVVAGKFLCKEVTLKNIFFSATLAVVFIHWIITDLGVWIGSSFYAQTIPGFYECLVAAIPFEFRFFAGTALYSALMFGTFEWMQRKNPALKTA